ncbi:conjugative transfer ATPase [Klebsiella aerogenes]|uniref:Conjugative transfer ATPase n=1 Tax=Klebsiella aerogenes TaxID=548 RepID=A0AAP9R1W8_KLEAE|nr:conjugative transfer ATPase [Klebsiella aerogenes]QMR42915.1 conjugative transfer ATPase [Klebsiella aerogenes]
MFPLFRKKVPQATTAPAAARPATEITSVAASGTADTLPLGEGVPFEACGHQTLPRPGRMTRGDERNIYACNPSFIDFLPWTEFLDEAQCLLLDDGVSVGAVYEVIPVATEGRPADYLETIRDTVEDALQDSFEEYDENPWVVQFFCQDEDECTVYMDSLRAYIKPHAQGTEFTQSWLATTERHMRGIARAEGLFNDELVTGQPWRGQVRRTRMVIYRYVEKNYREPLPPVSMLNQCCARITSALNGAGIRSERQNGHQVHDWLLRLFNPAPAITDKETLYRAAAYFDKRDEPAGTMPVSNDFAEMLMFSPPRSDTKNGVWWLDNLAHCAVTVEKLRRAPQPGHLSGERTQGDKINTLMDMFPEGTLTCMTLVVTPQDRLEEAFTRLGKNAVGENIESERVRADVQTAREYLGKRHKLWRAGLTFLLRSPDIDTLTIDRTTLTTILLNNGIQPVRPEHDVTPLNSWLRALPMCFNPAADKKHWFTRLTFVQHLAGLLPVTGRERGTGHPGMTFFNRGGGTLTCDPLNKLDRDQNAHLLLFGPTGSGKSATMCALAAQMMAVHRPRLFLAEAGNSFGLLADFFERLGLSVNKISIKPGSSACLPPFSDAHRLITEGLDDMDIDEETLPELDTADEEDEDKRDILGEMEIAARMMITGGEVAEEAKMSRSDRAMIRQAITMAARQTYDEGRMMRPSDLQTALLAIADDPERKAKRRERAADMAESLGMMTQPGSFEASLFDREGELWPEADVTLVDLGHVAREGYGAQMAMTMISMTNMVNAIAERDQYSARDIIFAIDEAHIATANPLLAPYMTKVVKMWRKLGAWLWLATQNMEDFPATAEKILNMAEWWMLLQIPEGELEHVCRFKPLSEGQKSVLLSARKLSGCYTEGAVLSKKIEALIRVVQPSIYLALAQTEKHEKAARRALMEAFHCSELDAALRVAQTLDEDRGLVSTSLNDAA